MFQPLRHRRAAATLETRLDSGRKKVRTSMLPTLAAGLDK
jgi:hypothetical protein